MNVFGHDVLIEVVQFERSLKWRLSGLKEKPLLFR